MIIFRFVDFGGNCKDEKNIIHEANRYNCGKYWLNWHQHCQKQYDCLAQHMQITSSKQQSTSTTEIIELTDSNEFFNYEFDYYNNLTTYNESYESLRNENNNTVVVLSGAMARLHLSGHYNLIIFLLIFVKKVYFFSL